MIRRIAATIAAVVLLLVLAVPAMAGGWAEIVADAQTTEPPIEGKPIEVGFRVMQHGVTPAPWEQATVHFTDTSTGSRIDVVATSDGSDGHFRATATLPTAGYWSWQVTLRDLISEHVPVSITVRTASGAMPAFDPSTALAAIDRARSDVTNDLNARFLPEIERLDGIAEANRVRIASLTTETRALAAERDALAARSATAEGVGGLPILAVLTLAVLAGASAGFAMAWLAGRPRPVVAFSASPQGADPV